MKEKMFTKITSKPYTPPTFAEMEEDKVRTRLFYELLCDLMKKIDENIEDKQVKPISHYLRCYDTINTLPALRGGKK